MLRDQVAVVGIAAGPRGRSLGRSTVCWWPSSSRLTVGDRLDSTFGRAIGADLDPAKGGSVADAYVSVTSQRVSRDRREWSSTIHRLLLHLQDASIEGLPVPLQAESPDQDVVSFVEGESAVDVVLHRDQVESLGRLVRSIHDAGADFADPSADVWQQFEFRTNAPSTFGAPTFLSEIVIGHGDTGPWNVLTSSARSVSLIDWEFAGPIVRLDEIAATCWLNLRFHDPDVDAVAPLTSLRDKVSLLAVFLQAYGLGRDLWSAVVQGMIDYAIRDTAYEAARLDVSATTRPPDESTEWRLAWRSRSAAWMVRHRAEILALLSSDGDAAE